MEIVHKANFVWTCLDGFGRVGPSWTCLDVTFGHTRRFHQRDKMGVSLEEGKNIQLQMSHDEEIHSDKLYGRYILQFYNCKVDLRS